MKKDHKKRLAARNAKFSTMHIIADDKIRVLRFKKQEKSCLEQIIVVL